MFSIKTDNPLPDSDYFELSQQHMDENLEAWKQTGGGHHRNPEFNKRVYQLFSNSPLYILDIGCGGGNFIEDCINDGHYACGIDGWRIYKKIGLNAWGRFPDNFVQADIGKPFQILYNSEDVLFDLITSWECFEHIKSNDVPQMIENIAKHMKADGYIVFSTSINPDAVHRTTMNKEWWIGEFSKYGFVNTDINFYPHVVRDCPGSSYYCLQYKG